MSLWFSADQPSSQRLCSDQGLPSSSQNAPSTRFSCSRAGFTDLGMVDHQGWLLQQGVPFHLIHLRPASMALRIAAPTTASLL